MAGSAVEYLSDADGPPRGADVSCWQESPGGRIGASWKAVIRWKPDFESGGTGGQFEMTYPNPGGGANYVVVGRQQLGPMVDQALRLGSQAVFGDAFIT